MVSMNGRSQAFDQLLVLVIAHPTSPRAIPPAYKGTLVTGALLVCMFSLGLVPG